MKNMMWLFIIVSAALVLGVYQMVIYEKDFVMAHYGVKEGQDEQLHRLISRHLTLDIYQWVPHVGFSKRAAYTIGIAKEVWDWFEGKEIERKDLNANWQGCLEAEALILSGQVV